MSKPNIDEKFIQNLLHQLQKHEADLGKQVYLATSFALSVMHQNLGSQAPAYLVNITHRVIEDHKASLAANDPDYEKGVHIN